MKALFWLSVGLGAGATAAVLGGRWVRRQREAYAPAALARQAGRRAMNLSAVVADAAREFRAGAAERESELRSAVAAGSSSR
jgi:hypothetical protein